MNVTVLICSRDRAADLVATLASLSAVRVPAGWIVEVLVVDNGSGDETPNVVPPMQLFGRPVRYVREERGGKSVGLNSGLRASSGRLLLFSDDDVRFPADWIARMASPLADGSTDVVAGGVVIAPDLLRPWMTPLHRSWFASTENIDFSAQSELVGANMAITRAALEDVGGFDPQLGPGALGYMDDTLLGMRLRAAGYRFLGHAPASIEHHFAATRLTRDSLLRAAVGHGRSLAHVAWHYDQWQLPLLRLREWKHRITNAWRSRALVPPSDYATDDELIDARGRAFFKQFRAERQYPRKVELR